MPKPDLESEKTTLAKDLRYSSKPYRNPQTVKHSGGSSLSTCTKKADAVVDQWLT